MWGWHFARLVFVLLFFLFAVTLVNLFFLPWILVISLSKFCSNFLAFGACLQFGHTHSRCSFLLRLLWAPSRAPWKYFTGNNFRKDYHPFCRMYLPVREPEHEIIFTFWAISAISKLYFWTSLFIIYLILHKIISLIYLPPLGSMLQYIFSLARV